LTADPPYWPHLNIALPAIVLVAAVGAKSLGDQIKTAFRPVGNKIYCLILIGAIVLTGFSNWQIYYNYVKNNADPRIRISRYIASLPHEYYVYLASSDWSWNEYAFRFFNQNRSGQDLHPDKLEANPPVIKGPTVFILFKNSDLEPILEKLYPGGITEDHYDFDNLVAFTSYRIIPPGTIFHPVTHTFNPFALPGWWLIFGAIVFGIGWVTFILYKNYRSKSQGVNGSSGV